MATQSSPKGDWHRTWQAIHHQSHVAISLCAASFSDLCACACVNALHVRMWVHCPYASLYFVCMPVKTPLSQQNGTEARPNLEKQLSCFRIVLELK